MRKLHPGIRIDNIPSYRVGGAIFTIAILLITLIGVPASRPFFAAALPAGVAVGVLRYFWLKRTRG